nr:MAG TPA: hypothetical protein [Caudoviricetes sp.]
MNHMSHLHVRIFMIYLVSNGQCTFRSKNVN